MEKVYVKMINELTVKVANLTLENAELKARYELETEALTAQLDEATEPDKGGE
ncbi:TPA: hypothetical protein VBA39_001884 [Streptococcus agalactiae]|uniref:hypothetical protein n=1 Tax=Streptococcus agalactiae TaxID=1311 RepID=UPI000332D9FC|nr:hypothetical protein [Streptococcus agalactiae]QBX20728.1 hypothetical protein Javan53_0069 [Streptococcus phage Javan53]CCW39638.1 hypothetical protein MSA_7770 [Streptococcus agalactiae ILRI005]HEO6612775.1 hypothetical protein [Streptococcus agalactiae]HEO6620737.1 hypothetical protein [Streptococcus agalactiae]HEO6628616.1 hypothetical protein [Streptococcus agalactiae]